MQMKKFILSSISLFSMYSVFACTATGNVSPNPTPVPTVTTSVLSTIQPTSVPTIDPTVSPTDSSTSMPTTSPTSSASISSSPAPTDSNSSEYNYLIEKARTIPEIASCLNNSGNPNENITGSVEVTGTCFVQGNTKRVTFTAKPICGEGMICPQYLKVVATVEFDCVDNVTRTSCGS